MMDGLIAEYEGYGIWEVGLTGRDEIYPQCTTTSTSLLAEIGRKKKKKSCVRLSKMFVSQLLPFTLVQPQWSLRRSV